VSISTWALYSLNNDLQFQLLQEEIENIGKVVALEIDAEQHKKLTKTEHTNNALYHQLITPLVKIHNTIPNILYIYTMKIVKDKVYYVLDTASDKRTLRKEVNGGAVVMQEYLFDRDDPLYIKWLTTLRQGRIHTEDEYNLDEGEFILSTSIPLFDNDGVVTAVLGIDYDIRLFEQRKLLVQKVSITVLSFALLFSIILGWRVYAIRKKLNLQHIELYHQAHSDFLTGAYNRRHFKSRIFRNSTINFHAGY